jgi:hypothetical protein
MLIEAQKDLSTVDPFIAGTLLASGRGDLLEKYAKYYPSAISDIFIAAADVFVDMPLKKAGAITAYLNYNYYFFGDNYLRSMGKMNISRMNAKMAPAQGPGNSEWEVGTGHIVRGEAGWLLPKKLYGVRLQPFGALTWKNFEALDQASVQFDAGANFLQHGHNIKWTLQYSTRPVYTTENGRNIIDKYKGQFILQTQLFF